MFLHPTCAGSRKIEIYLASQLIFMFEDLQDLEVKVSLSLEHAWMFAYLSLSVCLSVAFTYLRIYLSERILQVWKPGFLLALFASHMPVSLSDQQYNQDFTGLSYISEASI